MAISLITSLFRSAAHLPHYVDAVQRVASILPFPLEIMVVANDATDDERQILNAFERDPVVSVTVLYTQRETLYASWNRGIEAAQYNLIGSWNVDDRRYAEGLIQAFQAFQHGAELVDMGYDLIQDHATKTVPAPYQGNNLSPKHGVSPFFLFERDLYQRAGEFNPNFRIAGDYEWSKREVVRDASYRGLACIGGQFVLHGDNLSGGANPLEWVEFNIALIWHEGFEHLRPVDPQLMRDTWEAWGYLGGAIPEQIADWLWGDDAGQRYQSFLRERNAHPMLRRIRLALARRGLLQSTEWDVQQRNKDRVY